MVPVVKFHEELIREIAGAFRRLLPCEILV